ncbi:MAG: DUF4194 domain-containing protein [Pirellula sp.]
MSNIFDQFVEDSQREEPPDEQSESQLGSTLAIESGSTGMDTATPRELKIAVQELLKQGFIEESQRRDLFRSVSVQLDAINRTLEPLDLAVRIDSHRGVAFLVIAKVEVTENTEEDSWNHPLVRKQRLTLEQSLLVAILRQTFAMHEQEYGVGQSAAKITIDELLPTFMTYFGDSGSDAKNENRLLQLLDQLKTHGIVSEVDAKQEILIRPLIAHLANPETLSALLSVLKEKKVTADSQGDE